MTLIALRLQKRYRNTPEKPNHRAAGIDRVYIYTRDCCPQCVVQNLTYKNTDGIIGQDKHKNAAQNTSVASPNLDEH